MSKSETSHTPFSSRSGQTSVASRGRKIARRFITYKDLEAGRGAVVRFGTRKPCVEANIPKVPLVFGRVDYLPVLSDRVD